MRPPPPRQTGGQIVRPPPRTGRQARRLNRQEGPKDNFRWWRGWPATVLLLIAASVMIYIGIGLWWLVKR